MNLFKKTTATIALVTLVSGIFSTGVFANSTSEIEAANALAAKGYINNHSDDIAAYNLNQNVLRQEIAAVARGIAGLEKKSTCENEFSDVTATTPNTWACYTVEALADAGLIAKNPKFNPEREITKAEAVAMMVKATFPEYAYDSNKGTSWQEQVVDFAVNKGVVASFTNYNTPATRGFVFESGYQAMMATAEDVATDTCDEVSTLLGLCGDTTTTDNTDTATNDNTTEDTNEDTTPVASTVASVELNPETANGADVPDSVSGVEVMKFDITAGNEDLTVNSITLKREGLGASNAVNSAVLFADNARISKAKTFNSTTDLAEVNITPALVVMAGETKTITVKVDTATSGKFRVALNSISASTDLDVSNVVSNQFEIVTVNTTTATIDTDGTVTDPKLGQDQAELLKFKINNNGLANEDIELTSITFKDDSSNIDTDVENLTLYHGTESVAVVPSVDGKYVTFNFASPIIIAEDKTEKFVVKGDIVAGAGDTINLFIDNVLDVTVKSPKNEYATVVENIDALTTNIPTIQAGQVTIIDTDPSDDTVLDNKKNVVFGTFKVNATSGKDLYIDSVAYTLEDNSNVLTGAIENVELYDATNGTTYDPTVVYSNANKTGKYTFSDLDIALADGSFIEFQIRADIVNWATTDKITASVNVASDVVIKESADDKPVSDKIPSAISFKDVEIVSADMSINALVQSDTDKVIGSSNVDAFDFEVRANNDASDLTVKELTFKGTVKDAKHEVTTLKVTAPATAAGNATVSLNWAAAINVPVTVSNIATNANEIASVINAQANYSAVSDWVDTVTVTASSYTNETDLVFTPVVVWLAVNTTVVDGSTAAGAANSDLSNTRVNALYLYDGDTLLASKSASELANGEVTFDGLNIVVAKNDARTLTVKMDILDDTNNANDTITLDLVGYYVEDSESDNVYLAGDTDGVLPVWTITSDRVVTIKGVGTLSVTVDNTDTETDKDKNVLAGTTSDFVASYELVAINEGVKINDLTINETSTLANDLQTAVAEVVLYANDKTTEIARQIVTSDTVTFNNVNYVVEEGSSNIYVKVVTHKIGKDEAGSQVADLTLEMNIEDAEGAESAKVVDVTAIDDATEVGNSKKFSVIPVKISNVAFVASQGGETVATNLTNGENTLGIIAITTDASNNTNSNDGSILKTLLNQFNVSVNTDALTSGELTAMTVQKINGVNATQAITPAATVDFAVAGLWTDLEIDNSTTVYYVIKGTFSGLSSSANKYVQIKLENLDTTAVAYSSNEAGAANITSLRIGTTSIDGTTISSNY